MPRSKSAKKRLRQSKKIRLRNKAVKTRVKNLKKKFFDALERGDEEEARQRLSDVTKQLHKAAGKGVIHRNKAARTQARLERKLSKTTAES